MCELCTAKNLRPTHPPLGGPAEGSANWMLEQLGSAFRLPEVIIIVLETEEDVATTAYDQGKSIGDFMAKQRAEGDFDYDCRFDLAEAAREGHEFFAEFKRGLDDALKTTA